MTPSMNCNVNYELWVTIICQYMFIIYNKGTALVVDIDNGGGYYICGNKKISLSSS